MSGPASDAEVLRIFALNSDPVLSSTEVAESLDVTQQAAYARLTRLVSEGYLTTKKVGARARIYWLTDVGEDYVSEEFADIE